MGDGLPFAGQTKHGNAVHGCDAEEEDHPLPREWIAGLSARARNRGAMARRAGAWRS